jgi:hypothetical protein
MMLRDVARFWGVPQPSALATGDQPHGPLVTLEIDPGELELPAGTPPRVRLPEPRALDGEPLLPARGEAGPVPLVVRRGDGVVDLAFDPGVAVERLVREGLFSARRPASARLPFHYHRVPPRLRRLLRDLMTRRAGDAAEGYPSWPIEPSVEAARRIWLHAARAADPSLRLPWRWPDAKRFALCLTHDVDTEAGLAASLEFAAEEEERGLRGCFYLVASAYPLDDGRVAELAAHGAEVGLHDLAHDNRLAFLPGDEIAERLDRALEAVDGLGVRGFRSPSMLRSPALYAALRGRFLYDSSVPDTGLLPERNGCATVFPFEVDGLPVVPLTVPPDGQLLSRGLQPAEVLAAWIAKCEWIAGVGGCAVHLTHPEPGFSAGAAMRPVLNGFLDWVRDRDDAWRALPADVAAHAAAAPGRATA